ncbi:hypothetical protein [Paenibacillus gorillae]|nr:hypothetical protein [Paenibacillus gorillae]
MKKSLQLLSRSGQCQAERADSSMNRQIEDGSQQESKRAREKTPKSNL